LSQGRVFLAYTTKEALHDPSELTGVGV
jgi:hypothetical protein